MTYRVIKPFRAGGREYNRGESVDPFQFRTGQQLINQRMVMAAPDSDVSEPKREAKRYSR